MAYSDKSRSQWADRSFVKRSLRAPILTREREFEIARRWREHDDEDALHELVISYTRLVISTAAKFRNYGLQMGDLIQEGNIGLMQAAARFEPSREVRFSTYAAWWIRSAMQDFILRNWSIVRTGTTAAQKSLFFNFRRLRARIDDGIVGPLGYDGKMFIANELGVTFKDVEAMEGRLSSSDQSLNATIGENGEDAWQDFIADSRPTPEDIVIEMRDSETRSRWLAKALEELNERERTIISERRLKDESVTLEELGKELGISKERVRQIEHRAIEKLRASLETKIEHPSDLLHDS